MRKVSSTVKHIVRETSELRFCMAKQPSTCLATNDPSRHKSIFRQPYSLYLGCAKSRVWTCISLWNRGEVAVDSKAQLLGAPKLGYFALCCVVIDTCVSCRQKAGRIVSCDRSYPDYGFELTSDNLATSANQLLQNLSLIHI